MVSRVRRSSVASLLNSNAFACAEEDSFGPETGGEASGADGALATFSVPGAVFAGDVFGAGAALLAVAVRAARSVDAGGD